MKNKKRMILSIVICVILVLGAATFCMWKYLNNYNTALQANWKISIPAKAHYSETYRKDSGPSFLGDGIRYHIFSYKNHTYVEEMLDWGPDGGKTIFYGSYSDTVNVWLDAIEVPANYRPDYANCQFWYQSKNDSSEIIILWNKETCTLYVVESFL